MHVDSIDQEDGKGTRTFNVNVAPHGFRTTYQQQNATCYDSSTTNTTSWSFGAKETFSFGYTVGKPSVAGLKTNEVFTAAQKLKGESGKTHNTYSKQTYNLSAITGFGDEVTYVGSEFNVWVYPVIGSSGWAVAPQSCGIFAVLFFH